MGQKFEYEFSLDVNKGFKQEHPLINELMYSNRHVVQMTESEFSDYRQKLQNLYSIELAEIERKPYFEPETVF